MRGTSGKWGLRRFGPEDVHAIRQVVAGAVPDSAPDGQFLEVHKRRRVFEVPAGARRRRRFRTYRPTIGPVIGIRSAAPKRTRHGLNAGEMGIRNCSGCPPSAHRRPIIFTCSSAEEPTRDSRTPEPAIPSTWRTTVRCIDPPRTLAVEPPTPKARAFDAQYSSAPGNCAVMPATVRARRPAHPDSRSRATSPRARTMVANEIAMRRPVPCARAGRVNQPWPAAVRPNAI